MSFHPTQLKYFTLKCYSVEFKITCHTVRLTIFIAPVSMCTANYKFFAILSTALQNKIWKLKITNSILFGVCALPENN